MIPCMASMVRMASKIMKSMGSVTGMKKLIRDGVRINNCLKECLNFHVFHHKSSI